MQWELKLFQQIKGLPFVTCEIVLFFVATFKWEDIICGPPWPLILLSVCSALTKHVNKALSL